VEEVVIIELIVFSLAWVYRISLTGGAPDVWEDWNRRRYEGGTSVLSAWTETAGTPVCVALEHREQGIKNSAE
jgi:hypothetical protein